MANEKPNKVIYGGNVVIDLTEDTVTPETLLAGIKAHNASGNQITGIATLGGATITVTYGSDFYGETITCTLGTKTYSKVATSSGEVEFTVDEEGTWTISCLGITTTVDIELEYESELVMIPDGKTVLPTDDIATWLACAKIRDKSYTTLAKVLEDSVTFNALLGDSNACDYMARSTTFGKAVSTVPILSSDTGSNGETFARGMSDNTHCYNIFDGDDTTYAYSYYQTASPSFANDGYYWFGYHFNTPIIVRRMYTDVYNETSANTTGTFTLQGSNDGETWTDVSTPFTLTKNSSSPHDIRYTDIDTNGVAYAYYRLEEHNSATSRPSFNIYTLELYSDVDITTNPLAMSLLGRYDYACEALLANEDWAEAIANSEYYESVLDTKVPTMTSDTTPSGVVSASSLYSSNYPAWHAFDSDRSHGWLPSNSSGEWLQYEFPEPCKVAAVSIEHRPGAGSDYYTSLIGKIQGSNDGVTFVDISGELSTPTYSTIYTFGIGNDTAYKYYRYVVVSTTPAGAYGYGFNLQFYGRHSSQILIPLVPTMTSNTTPSGVASASAADSGYEAYKAFDGDTPSTFWRAPQASGAGTYLRYEFPSAVKVVAARIREVNNNNSRAKYKIQGSNDGATWVDLTAEITSPTTEGEVENITLNTNDTAYKYYQILYTYRYGTYNLAMSVFQLYKESESGVLHSAPYDTIFYLVNNVETVLCTCDADGVAEVDWNTLDLGEIQLYSTIAKDPDNLSDEFGMTIRVTPNKVDAFLIPDKALYWYGYESSCFEDAIAANGWSVDGYFTQIIIATRATNTLTMQTSASRYYSGVGTKYKVSGEVFIVVETGTVVSGELVYGAADFPAKASGGGNLATTSAKARYSLGVADDTYAMVYTCNGRSVTISCMYVA